MSVAETQEENSSEMSQPSTSVEVGSRTWKIFSKCLDAKTTPFGCTASCAPKYHELMAFKNSLSNLKKHIKKKHPTRLERYTKLTSAALRRKSSTEGSLAHPPKKPSCGRLEECPRL